MTNGKLKLAVKFFDVAQEQLKKYEETKDELCLWQACEKGWGAVARALKVVNPQIKRHAEFGRTAAELAEKYNNEDISRAEAYGEMLHSKGFYEGVLDPLSVKHGLICIDNFLKLIDNILNNGKGGKNEKVY